MAYLFSIKLRSLTDLHIHINDQPEEVDGWQPAKEGLI